MNRSFNTLMLLLIFLSQMSSASMAAEKRSLTLARDGQPSATIVLATQPTRAAQLAAYELQWHVKEITGATLPIVKDDQPVTGLRVLVGESAATRALKLPATPFAPQEYLVQFLPDALVLMGRDKADFGAVDYAMKEWSTAWESLPYFWDDHATLYAAYELLESHCGVRWLTPTETGTVIPKRLTLTVTGDVTRRTPGYLTRNTWTLFNSEGYYDCHVLWKIDSPEYKELDAMAFAKLQRQFPDRWQYLHAKRFYLRLHLLRLHAGGEKSFANHSLYRYYDLYWEKNPDHPIFEEKRPQYFAQGYAGKPPQMCYTNSDFIKMLIDEGRNYFDKGGYPGPDAGSAVTPGYHWGENFFTVEPMDNASFCKCPDCNKFAHKDLDHRGVFSSGQDSDYFFNFVNEVAKGVKKTNPEKYINTLAYMSHTWPPKTLTLEPNVAVHFCFTNNRMPWCTREYANEMAAYQAWRKDKDRAMYLWFYDGFPLEIGQGGNFHVFPGATAHTIDKQLKMFAKDGVKGVFFCGFGQEVEAYVNHQLLFDPAKDVDAILDDFFTGLYGPAAGPMKDFYLEMERAYSDPKNYPEDIADGKIISHQTEDLAWGYLGREDRMNKLGALVEKAKELAATDAEKTNVALFERGVWQYMQQGRQAFLKRIAVWYGGVPTRKVPAIIGATPVGDPLKVDWSDSTAITSWRSRLAEPTLHRITARLAHDSQHLYLRLEERFGPNTQVSDADSWQIIFAKQQALPYRQLRITSQGTLANVECREITAMGERAWTIDAEVRQEKSDSLMISLALPLKELVPGGVKAGEGLYMNIIHRSPTGDDQPMWVPTFGELDSVLRLGYLRLENIVAPKTLLEPADPTALRQGLVGEWRLDEGAGDVTKDSSGNGLDGKLINDPIWETGKVNSGLRGMDYQCVEIGNDPKVRLTESMTMMAWVKPSQRNAFPAVMGKGYEGNGGYGLQFRPDWSLWFELNDALKKRYYYNPTDLVAEPNAWNHVAATYNGAMMRIYINGHEAGEGMACAIPIRDTPELFRLGWLGSYGFFVGTMDEARLYNRALTQQEIMTIYREQKAPRIP